jgi:hypothetical protein
MKDSHVISSLPPNETVNTTPESVEFSAHDEQHLNQIMGRFTVMLLGGASGKRLQSLLVMISLFIS